MEGNFDDCFQSHTGSSRQNDDRLFLVLITHRWAIGQQSAPRNVKCFWFLGYGLSRPALTYVVIAATAHVLIEFSNPGQDVFMNRYRVTIPLSHLYRLIIRDYSRRIVRYGLSPANVLSVIGILSTSLSQNFPLFRNNASSQYVKEL